jgi:hypothetical protein
MLDRIKKSENIVELIETLNPEGKNTKFLSSSHNLWYRFKNYDKHPPFVMKKGGEPVAMVFATFSNNSKYINLYEIVTMDGQEGKGYATEIWEEVMGVAYADGMRRLKLSCTPSSVTWHNRNGLIFWAVDPSGSLRSDQPLYSSKAEQLKFREQAIENPNIAFPKDQKVIDRLLSEGLESHKFGMKKKARVEQAIESVGVSWLRDYLVNDNNSATLDKFMEQ